MAANHHDMEYGFCLYDRYKKVLINKNQYYVKFKNRSTGEIYNNVIRIATWDETIGFIVNIDYTEALSLPFDISIDIEVYAMKIYHSPKFSK